MAAAAPLNPPTQAGMAPGIEMGGGQMPCQPPPGAPAGGHMVHEKYMGTVTMVAGGAVCLLTCCGCLVLLCPCDERDVYVAPNGQKYNLQGAIVQ